MLVHRQGDKLEPSGLHLAEKGQRLGKSQVAPCLSEGGLHVLDEQVEILHIPADRAGADRGCVGLGHLETRHSCRSGPRGVRCGGSHAAGMGGADLSHRTGRGIARCWKHGRECGRHFGQKIVIVGSSETKRPASGGSSGTVGPGGAYSSPPPPAVSVSSVTVDSQVALSTYSR